MSKVLKTVNGEMLMNTFLPPIEFAVENLIPQGLHILSGSPKIGKSWLALMLCLKVAKGEKLWNFETKQGTALYLCLEDSLARIQSRLFDITDDAPPNIHFATFAESIGSGIEEQIENFCLSNKNTKLVVIDTFQKIRTISNDNAYASDYRDISILKNIADKLKIAIVLIHHLRKQKDDDPMNMVSGTTGITGGQIQVLFFASQSAPAHGQHFIARDGILNIGNWNLILIPAAKAGNWFPTVQKTPKYFSKILPQLLFGLCRMKNLFREHLQSWRKDCQNILTKKFPLLFCQKGSIRIPRNSKSLELPISPNGATAKDLFFCQQPRKIQMMFDEVPIVTVILISQ